MRLIVSPKWNRAAILEPILDVLWSGRALAFVLVCLGLTCCAPAPPPGVPVGADVDDWDPLTSRTWSWKRTLQSGCVTWRANERWASVQLVLDSRCEGWRGEGRLPGRGVSYRSYSDYLVFREYWPWTQQMYSDLFVYDNKGMIRYVGPCPHALSPEQLGGLRLIAQEALAAATTDRERRVVARINERLAMTNGTALESEQEGCTDEPPGRRTHKYDPWMGRKWQMRER